MQFTVVHYTIMIPFSIGRAMLKMIKYKQYGMPNMTKSLMICSQFIHNIHNIISISMNVHENNCMKIKSDINITSAWFNAFSLIKCLWVLLPQSIWTVV